MPVVPYSGTYARFNAMTKEQGVCLQGADCIVGDELAFVRDDEGVRERIWLENRFGGRVGALDTAGAGMVLLCQAKEWRCRILLASVYATTDDDGFGYWGEVAIMAYPPGFAESFDVFSAKVAEKLAEGARPTVDLQQSSLAQIVDAGGDWLPNGRVAALDPAGSVLVKDHRGFWEGMIEQARNRNPGCMAVGWAFIALLAAAAVWTALRLMGV